MDKKRNALNEMRVMVILEEVQFVTCRFSGVQCRRRFIDFTWNMRKECESNKNERVNDREKGEKRVKTQRRAEGNNGQRERETFLESWHVERSVNVQVPAGVSGKETTSVTPGKSRKMRNIQN